MPEEARFHINYLELKAALFALQSFQNSLGGKHVRIMLDNTTAVGCISHMGTSHSDECNDITYKFWEWCIDRDIYLLAAYISVRYNTAADVESRATNVDAKWKLNSAELHRVLEALKVDPDIDLFTSRLSRQLPRYVAYRPDPAEALAVNAFSLS